MGRTPSECHGHEQRRDRDDVGTRRQSIRDAETSAARLAGL
jgi:hypothetical protein